MNSDAVREENVRFVLARLQLAQALLEDSDKLPGWTGFDLKSEKEWWKHARHEREALVNYLLLTCFDRLGQERGFTTFQDWLMSRRAEHVSERHQVIQALELATDPLESASALAEHYQALYGVRNSFYRGIESLSDEIQQKLLRGITIGINPMYGTLGSNTSSRSFTLNDDVLERKLKLKYLFDKRNRFTHRLEQYFAGSSPFPFSALDENGPSWTALIQDSRLSYLSGNQEVELLPAGGARIYSTTWPFVLFETLHAAIGSVFDRTDIKLRFWVMLRRSSVPDIVIKIEVEHHQLKDFRALESRLWDLHAKGGVPSGPLLPRK